MRAFILISVLFTKFDSILTDCTDIYGRSITPGIHFIPGPDICQLCVCDNTTPKWCKRVLCSPPQNCKSFVMGSSCCDYSCLDNTIPNVELRDEIDRRFLITIATAFLILSVLLFIIHKLRHRTIHVSRLQNRQLNEDRRSIGSIGFITGSIGYLNLSNGHHFDDHPLVHFPVYKPHASYFPRGEAPPPYEEAMADTALNVSVTTQLLNTEREIQELNQQRRRCNSAGVAMVAHQQRANSSERCVCDPQQQIKDNRTQVDLTDVYGCAAQHRTIPLPICVTPESLNQHANCSSSVINSLNRRSCPVHNKKINDPNCRADTEQRSRANSTGRAQPTTSTRHNTCPPQFHFEAAHGAPPQHRTLPLSASLSSPLPSTSDTCDRGSQFTTFSSAINISSVDGNESTPNTLEPLSKQPSHAKKSLPSVSVTNESQHNRKSKKTTKCPNPKDHVTASTAVENTKEPKPETDSSQLVEDYHAECENCNLNVNPECDVADEYFSEQETMTLQRKLHEVSAAKSNEQAMKVSLTLPTNSRTRRCSSKNRKCGRWNAKESPFKTMLEYVSSEEEEIEADKSQPNKNDNEENI